MCAELTIAPEASDLAELVEFGEGEAYADMHLAAAAAIGTRVERIGAAIVLLAPSIPIILFNRVIGLGLRRPASEAGLDEIAALFRDAGIARFAVPLSPAAQPHDLPAWLAARNLVRRDNWAKVYRLAAPAVEIPTDLQIQTIDASHAAAFAGVACTAFGVPLATAPLLTATIGRSGWRHYLAFDGDQAVATAALYVRDGIGWLGVGSTLPSHRRRGAQGALMAQRVRDGAALGCRWLVTETGEDTPDQPNPSYHNMLRTGFRLAYQRPNYVT